MDWTPRQASIVAALALLAMAPLGAVAGLGLLPDAPAGLVLTLVAVLDILVGVALWRALGSGVLPLLAAVLRISYAAVLVVAASRLSAGFRPEFETIWQGGLAVFGLHLVVVGAVLVARRGVFARLTGILVLIAGLGYTIDAAAFLLSPGLALGIGQLTFVGELVLIAWLLARGGRPVAVPAAPCPAVA